MIAARVSADSADSAGVVVYARRHPSCPRQCDRRGERAGDAGGAAVIARTVGDWDFVAVLAVASPDVVLETAYVVIAALPDVCEVAVLEIDLAIGQKRDQISSLLDLNSRSSERSRIRHKVENPTTAISVRILIAGGRGHAIRRAG
ncbi:hypothetical protein ACQI4L_03290 [Mycolicibacterium litorale]|uniref:hypothetical protein n=1 Tax=Mycolicibacterium litorale TaxID=758802 RepID=UPI003CF395F2